MVGRKRKIPTNFVPPQWKRAAYDTDTSASASDHDSSSRNLRPQINPRNRNQNETEKVIKINPKF